MIDTYIPISQLQAGQKYLQVCLVESVVFRRSRRTQKPYAQLTIKDVTGTVSGWVIDFSNKSALQPGRFVRLGLEVADSKEGGLQFYVNDQRVEPVKGEPENINDYILGPNPNVIKVYSDDVMEYVDKIADSDLRDFVQNAMQRIEIMNALQTSPYGLEGNLAYRGGLLVHTFELLRAAENMNGLTPDVTRYIDDSMLIVGALFRNIGYMSTTRNVGGIMAPKDSWHLIGPRRASFMIINHMWINAESNFQRSFPEGKKLALQNICAAENLNEVYTVEGKIVLSANYMVDAMHQAETSLLSAVVGTDDWAERLFIGHLK